MLLELENYKIKLECPAANLFQKLSKTKQNIKIYEDIFGCDIVEALKKRKVCQKIRNFDTSPDVIPEAVIESQKNVAIEIDFSLYIY